MKNDPQNAVIYTYIYIHICMTMAFTGKFMYIICILTKN